MPDIHAHKLAVEINEPLSLRSPEINPLGAVHRKRIHLGLSRPLEQSMLPRKSNDFFAGHAYSLLNVSRYCFHHELKILPACPFKRLSLAECFTERRISAQACSWALSRRASFLWKHSGPSEIRNLRQPSLSRWNASL